MLLLSLVLNLASVYRPCITMVCVETEGLSFAVFCVVNRWTGQLETCSVLVLVLVCTCGAPAPVRCVKEL